MLVHSCGNESSRFGSIKWFNPVVKALAEGEFNRPEKVKKPLVPREYATKASSGKRIKLDA